MQRLGVQDSLTVYGESSGWPQHMGSLMVFAPRESGEPLDLAAVLAVYGERLPRLPVFRHRIVKVPVGLDRPVWVDVPDLDVREHITGMRLPESGTDEQLAEVVSELHVPFIDLSRPPWDMTVIEGLSGGRTAVYSRLHHAMVDGERGRAVQLAMYDLDAHGRQEVAEVTGDIEDDGSDERVPAPTNRRLVGAGLVRLGTTPLRLVRTATHLAGSGRRLLSPATLRDLRGMSRPGSAPRTRFNASITANRAIVFITLPLDPVKQLGQRHQATVNDVILALMGGALRRYLGAHDELPVAPLTAVVPVAQTGGSAKAVPGNQWGVALASLASDQEDFAERLRLVVESTRAAKAMTAAIGPDLFDEMTDVPPGLIAAFSGLYARLGLAARLAPMANTTVSNTRGPSFALYLGGARLEAGYPVGPLADGLGLNITVMSYDGHLDVGIAVCPDRVSDPWALVEALRAEYDEVVGGSDNRVGLGPTGHDEDA